MVGLIQSIISDRRPAETHLFQELDAFLLCLHVSYSYLTDVWIGLYVNDKSSLSHWILFVGLMWKAAGGIFRFVGTVTIMTYSLLTVSNKQMVQCPNKILWGKIQRFFFLLSGWLAKTLSCFLKHFHCMSISTLSYIIQQHHFYTQTCM